MCIYKVYTPVFLKIGYGPCSQRPSQIIEAITSVSEAPQGWECLIHTEAINSSALDVALESHLHSLCAEHRWSVTKTLGFFGDKFDGYTEIFDRCEEVDQHIYHLKKLYELFQIEKHYVEGTLQKIPHALFLQILRDIQSFYDSVWRRKNVQRPRATLLPPSVRIIEETYNTVTGVNLLDLKELPEDLYLKELFKSLINFQH